MERAKLEEFNPWWITGKVDLDLALPFKRELYCEIEKHLTPRFITALTGLRRVGKTTAMYQLIQKLLQEKVQPDSILFFSFDDSISSLGDVLATYKEIHAKDFRQEKVYAFLDEIQKHLGWENELKKYYDLYPKLKFIISGSESLFIRKKTKESLAGRIFEFTLAPFTFREFLEFHGVQKKDFKYESKILPYFLKFAEKGGFPETFSFDNNRDFREYIRALVIDKIIYKDIPKIFSIDDPDFLIILLELIAANPGMYIDYRSLSRQFGKDRRVIKNYISYLKESYLIRVLGNYRKGSMTTLRKLKRAYPTDNALSYLYKPNIDESFFGRMIETLVINEIKAYSFWKNGNEIDIVNKDTPIEVKYQEKISNEDLKPLREFMKKFSKNDGILITKKDEKEITIEDGRIRFIPAWKWILEGEYVHSTNKRFSSRI